MNITPKKINAFMMLKLPAAYITGVRVVFISEEKSEVKVRLRWINQNPFKSMFWAVQGMAAELSTGILVKQNIDKVQMDISMLVTKMNASFYKKAKGKIMFTCSQGKEIDSVIKKAIETKQGQKIVLVSKGIDEIGEEVSSFQFEWSVKVK